MYQQQQQQQQQEQEQEQEQEPHKNGKTKVNQNLEAALFYFLCLVFGVLFCFCFSFCILIYYVVVVLFLKPYILCAVRLITLKYKKQSLLQVNFGSRGKKIKNVSTEGGQAHPCLEYTTLDLVGNGWIDTNSNQVLLHVLVYKTVKATPYIIVRVKRKRKIKHVWMRGGQAHPSVEYISGLNMIRFDMIWMDTRIRTNFRSFALVLWHRLQQRKLIQANVEKRKKTIKTQNHQKTARNKDSPEKQQKQETHKNRKHKSIKTWNLPSFDYFVFGFWCSFLFSFSFCILVF